MGMDRVIAVLMGLRFLYWLIRAVNWRALLVSSGERVPFSEISETALRGLIEDYVTSEGTEYGVADVDLETKVAQVMRQIERGEVQIHFDPKSETVNLVPKDPR
jgi:uncharacterized protein YheU (UPF0270 family)